MSPCVGQVGNLFAAHRSTIITLYNGAFDSSSTVFLIFKVKECRHVSRAIFVFVTFLGILSLAKHFNSPSTVHYCVVAWFCVSKDEGLVDNWRKIGETSAAAIYRVSV